MLHTKTHQCNARHCRNGRNDRCQHKEQNKEREYFFQRKRIFRLFPLFLKSCRPPKRQYQSNWYDRQRSGKLYDRCCIKRPGSRMKSVPRRCRRCHIRSIVNCCPCIDRLSLQAMNLYSTLIIRYPTPICVWIYCGDSSPFSIFFRKVAIKTLRDATSFSQLLPHIFCVINVCVSTFPTFRESRHKSLDSHGVRCSSSSSKNAHPAA